MEEKVKFAELIIEQIIAADHLINKNNHLSSRLALILTDNAIELLLYKQVILAFSHDILYKYNISPQFPLETRTQITGSFIELNKFVHTNLNLLSINEYESIKFCHELRNKAYHESILREDFINEISKEYFHLCCELLSRLLPDYSSLFEINIEKTFHHYGKKDLSLTVQKLKTEMIRISQNIETNPKNLAYAMSGNLKTRIGGIIANLNYFGSFSQNDSPILSDETFNTLKWIQFYHEPKPQGVDKEDYEKLFDDYHPKINKRQINLWINKSEKIKDLSDVHDIIRHFNLIDADIESINKIADEAVRELDEYIDWEVEIREDEYRMRKYGQNDG
ncbi:MAG: hypothetical protein V1862_05945 [Methanobacteriota archaeon]